MNRQYILIGMLSAALFGGLAGCEREGTMERAGEEVDEAVDTVKEGEESTGNQVDDAVDEMREGVNDAADEARNE
jgi:hypothetical protein